MSVYRVRRRSFSRVSAHLFVSGPWLGPRSLRQAVKSPLPKQGKASKSHNAPLPHSAPTASLSESEPAQRSLWRARPPVAVGHRDASRDSEKSVLARCTIASRARAPPQLIQCRKAAQRRMLSITAAAQPPLLAPPPQPPPSRLSAPSYRTFPPPCHRSRQRSSAHPTLSPICCRRRRRPARPRR